MARLFFVGLDGSEKSYRLQTHRPFTVGRDPGNDITLRDPKVSRHHAEIVFERGFFVLHDLASANGTYVNGKRVRIAPLIHGAKLRVGNIYGHFSEDATTENDAFMPFDQPPPIDGDATMIPGPDDSVNLDTVPNELMTEDVKKKLEAELAAGDATAMSSPPQQSTPPAATHDSSTSDSEEPTLVGKAAEAAVTGTPLVVDDLDATYVPPPAGPEPKPVSDIKPVETSAPAASVGEERIRIPKPPDRWRKETGAAAPGPRRALLSDTAENPRPPRLTRDKSSRGEREVQRERTAEEPRPSARRTPAATPPPPAPQPAEPLPAEFTPFRFHFTAGVGPGETARISDELENVLLTFRGFASNMGIIVVLSAVLFLLAGVAVATFNVAKGNPLLAIIAVVLTFFFALIVLMMIPASTVTLFAGATPALTITQISRSAEFRATWAVVLPDGRTVATLQKNVFSRAGRNRWTIRDASGRRIGTAADESLTRAYLRIVVGKFDRRFEADVHVTMGNARVATIYRRPDPVGAIDVLQISGDLLDHRVAVALATLVLGSEP
jgi:hypothetical protein